MKSTIRKKATAKPKVVKKKAVNEEVVYVKKEIPYDEKKHGYLSSHTIKCPPVKIPYDYTPNVTIYSMITGCGLFALRGFTWMNKDNIKAAKDTMKLVLDYVGNRTLIATLGDSYKPTQAIMEELGFEKIASYHNPGHGSTQYKQHLYIIRNGKNKNE